MVALSSANSLLPMARSTNGHTKATLTKHGRSVVQPVTVCRWFDVASSDSARTRTTMLWHSTP